MTKKNCRNTEDLLTLVKGICLYYLDIKMSWKITLWDLIFKLLAMSRAQLNTPKYHTYVWLASYIFLGIKIVFVCLLIPQLYRLIYLFIDWFIHYFIHYIHTYLLICKSLWIKATDHIFYFIFILFYFYSPVLYLLNMHQAQSNCLLRS